MCSWPSNQKDKSEPLRKITNHLDGNVGPGKPGRFTKKRWWTWQNPQKINESNLLEPKVSACFDWKRPDFGGGEWPKIEDIHSFQAFQMMVCFRWFSSSTNGGSKGSTFVNQSPFWKNLALCHRFLYDINYMKIETTKRKNLLLQWAPMWLVGYVMFDFQRTNVKFPQLGVRFVEIARGVNIMRPMTRETMKKCYNHQKFQVPKIEVLNLLFWGWCFPCITMFLEGKNKITELCGFNPFEKDALQFGSFHQGSGWK